MSLNLIQKRDAATQAKQRLDYQIKVLREMIEDMAEVNDRDLLDIDYIPMLEDPGVIGSQTTAITQAYRAWHDASHAYIREHGLP